MTLPIKRNRLIFRQSKFPQNPVLYRVSVLKHKQRLLGDVIIAKDAIIIDEARMLISN